MFNLISKVASMIAVIKFALMEVSLAIFMQFIYYFSDLDYYIVYKKWPNKIDFDFDFDFEIVICYFTAKVAGSTVASNTCCSLTAKIVAVQ